LTASCPTAASPRHAGESPQRTAATAERVEATHEGKRLSDHDAYVVDADL
jgi:hypothetical protein